MIHCIHIWNNEKLYSKHTHLIRCSKCNKTAIGKPSIWLPPSLPYAANEYLCYQLLKLLKERGCDIRVAEVYLVQGIPIATGIDNRERSPWYHSCAIIEDLNVTHGVHGRISRKTIKSNLKWPDWLFWFDTWIGRVDASGDNNLLLFSDETVIPIDFELAFPWAHGFTRDRVRAVDDMYVATLPEIYLNRSDKIREEIKKLTDDDIWQTVVCDLPVDLISPATLVAIWSGLCLRKKLI